MDIKEKIGQLIISRPRAKDIEKNVSKGIIGGLYVPPNFDVEQIKELKYKNKTPLLIAADLECGELSLSNTWSCAMAAAQSGENGVYEWAKAQAIEARNVHVDAVFGPVFDTAFTRNGIATGFRTLSDNPAEVAKLGYKAVKGYQDGGLLTFCKHYPGFGRAEDDAHISLSNINVDKETLFKEDLLPYFKSAYQNPLLSGVMTGHIMCSCIDNIPSPMSKKLIDVLRDNGFNGLIMTDSLAMKSIQFYYSIEELYVGALKSGHDIILMDYNTDDEEGFEWIYKAYKDNILSEKEIDEKVNRILKTKSYIQNLPKAVPDYKQNKKIFDILSDNSIEYGKKVDKTEDTLFIIADEKTENVSGEVAFSNKGITELKKEINSHFKNNEILTIDTCPSADTIADVLLSALHHEQVIFIVHAPIKAYAGTSHYHKPIISLVEGIKNKIKAFIVWGNPYAGDDLPKDLNIFKCYDFGNFANSVFKKL